MDADADRELGRVARGQGAALRRDRIVDSQAGAQGTFGIVLLRMRIAEINQRPVAQILGDMAAEAIDRFGDGAMILGDDIAPFLGIEACRDLRRADKIAEHHRKMAPLARGREAPDLGAAIGRRRRGRCHDHGFGRLMLLRRRGGACFRRGRCLFAQSRNGIQQSAAIAHQGHAEIF